MALRTPPETLHYTPIWWCAAACPLQEVPVRLLSPGECTHQGIWGIPHIPPLVGCSPWRVHPQGYVLQDRHRRYCTHIHPHMVPLQGYSIWSASVHKRDAQHHLMMHLLKRSSWRVYAPRTTWGYWWCGTFPWRGTFPRGYRWYYMPVYRHVPSLGGCAT